MTGRPRCRRCSAKVPRLDQPSADQPSSGDRDDERRQLGFEGPILTTDTQFIDAVGAPAALNTYTMQPRFLTLNVAVAAGAPQRIQDNLAMYEQAMTDAGHVDLIVGNAQAAFASVMDIAMILEMIPEGPIDLDSISAVLDEDRWIIGFDSADFNCGADRVARGSIVLPGLPADLGSHRRGRGTGPGSLEGRELRFLLLPGAERAERDTVGLMPERNWPV